ncbi:competence protein ComER [Halobacillus alkaliphilus]|uniref:Pyrroline-5-carboxylate reductase n=1 Tax=Halobacillus alkaliphilus TaxID=396056 RepID=A0A1I2JF79_9BACI|nr:late competence protein ComER [Halobacillus alkaliphilus]SFF53214.1 competence protein ComER [Halobacillus alkaliphilus]
MKWGIIGTGNMGSMLVTSLVKSGAVCASDLIIYNRTAQKALDLQKDEAKLTVAESLEEVAKKSDILFLCVKPHHYSQVLNEIKNDLTLNQCLVSITSPVSVEDLENKVSCQVARIVPSITNHAHAGVSLFTFGTRVTDSVKQSLLNTFEYISKPSAIEEDHIRAASDMVSCGPAFISFLLKNWIEAAGEVTGISEKKATELTENMMIGLGSLLSKEIFTLDELMEKVTVKGGVTGEGLKALEAHIGSLFQEMFKATQTKHKEDKFEIDL